MNVSFEANCKTPSCKNVLQMYVPPLPESQRQQWCPECDQVHTYSRGDFQRNHEATVAFNMSAASVAAGD